MESLRHTRRTDKYLAHATNKEIEQLIKTSTKLLTQKILAKQNIPLVNDMLLIIPCDLNNKRVLNRGTHRHDVLTNHKRNNGLQIKYP